MTHHFERVIGNLPKRTSVHPGSEGIAREFGGLGLGLLSDCPCKFVTGGRIPGPDSHTV
jgi:hypothetical protein